MPDRQWYPTDASVWFLTALVVLAVLAMPASVAAAGQPGSTAAATQSAYGGAAGQVGPACDYAGLYEDTIDSVVRVSRGPAEGSGFVYDSFEENATSYVVTNQHVVGDAETVTVRFREGQYQRAPVVGRDAFADLAVVRVDRTPDAADPLPVAERVPGPGTAVAAFGSPFGLQGSITHGIVSGVNRSMPTDRGYAVPDVVQTDAPINPGNSGGPLVACDGTVVGVSTAGIQAGVGENVGFAVSTTLIQRVVPALIAEGDVSWPYLGLRSTDVTPAVADANDLDLARGVAVVDTDAGGPSQGPLRPPDEVRTVDGQPVPVGGDVIVAIDGRRVDTGEDLSSYLATEAAPGDVVTLTVIRNGERQAVNVTLGERPSPRTAAGG